MLRLPLPAEPELLSSSLASNGTVSSVLTCSLSDNMPSRRPNRGARIAERGGAGGGLRTRVGGLATNEGGCSERALR
jgi:hypothetical protein